MVRAATSFTSLLDQSIRAQRGHSSVAEKKYAVSIAALVDGALTAGVARVVGKVDVGYVFVDGTTASARLRLKVSL